MIVPDRWQPSISSIPPYASFAAAVIAVLVACYFYLNHRAPFPVKSPPAIKGNYPVVGGLGFFGKRWEFFRTAMANSASGNFSFHVGKMHVVGVSGFAGRQAFFESKQLGFAEGYEFLFGQGPQAPKDVKTVKSDEDTDFSNHFSKRLTTMLRRENMAKVLPLLIADTKARLDELAASPNKITDPFDSVYKIVYQLTMRTVGCNDIAEDQGMLAKTLGYFESFASSTTATTIIFPWLPTPALIRRTYAGTKLYMTFKSILDERKRTSTRGDDPLQYLVDQGDSLTEITTFVMGALFAGQLNSGINAAYVLAHLATNPVWLAKALAEIESVARTHSTLTEDSASLFSRLCALPIDAWDSKFPVLDLCLKDSIRLSLLGSGFRRNVSGRDVKIGEEVVPHGAFVTYHLAEMHNNPSIYPDPTRWDPGRYLPDRAEDKKAPYAWVGWGAGRHPCLGMKFAKLEQNIIIALFLSRFSHTLCDRHGVPLDPPTLPEIDVDSWSAGKPTQPIYFKLVEKV